MNAAFLSYSHADEGIADLIHKRVERYRIPNSLNLGKSRIGKIVRDRVDFAASADLGKDITAALDNSEALILLCSPNSAKSKFVEQEIVRFKTTGKADKIFAVIVSGKAFASGKPGWTDADECFPPALIFKVDDDGVVTDEMEDALPFAADIRDGRDEFANGSLKLIAGLLGVGLDDLIRREKIQQNRRMLAASIASVVFAGLLLFSLFALNNAQNQRAAAEEANLNLAEANTALIEAIAAADEANENLTESNSALIEAKASLVESNEFYHGLLKDLMSEQDSFEISLSWVTSITCHYEENCSEEHLRFLETLTHENNAALCLDEYDFICWVYSDPGFSKSMGDVLTKRSDSTYRYLMDRFTILLEIPCITRSTSSNSRKSAREWCKKSFFEGDEFRSLFDYDTPVDEREPRPFVGIQVYSGTDQGAEIVAFEISGLRYGLRQSLVYVVVSAPHTAEGQIYDERASAQLYVNSFDDHELTDFLFFRWPKSNAFPHIFVDYKESFGAGHMRDDSAFYQFNNTTRDYQKYCLGNVDRDGYNAEANLAGPCDPG